LDAKIDDGLPLSGNVQAQYLYASNTAPGFTTAPSNTATAGGNATSCYEYVAPRVMLRICDWALSRRRLTASTQHNLSVPREVA
jgi:hypothetical protein